MLGDLNQIKCTHKHQRIVKWFNLNDNMTRLVSRILSLFVSAPIMLVSVLPHLEPVIGPTPKLHHTSLLVKGKVFHIHLGK